MCTWYYADKCLHEWIYNYVCTGVGNLECYCMVPRFVYIDPMGNGVPHVYMDQKLLSNHQSYTRRRMVMVASFPGFTTRFYSYYTVKNGLLL